MDYADAKREIEDGDVLLVQGVGPFAWLTRLVQRLGGLNAYAKCTHVGVAWWMHGALWSIEMDGQHNVARRLSQHLLAGCKVQVCRPPVLRAELRGKFHQATRMPINYGQADLLWIGARLVLGVPERTEGNADLVCSTFVPRWWTWAGWPRAEALALRPCPAELAKWLCEQDLLKFELTPTVEGDTA